MDPKGDPIFNLFVCLTHCICCFYKTLRIIPDSWETGVTTDPYSFKSNSLDRSEVKQLLVRLIGSGNCWKNAGYADWKMRESLAKVVHRDRDGKPMFFKGTEKYKILLDRLNEEFPFLASLEKGKLDGQTLAFHEAEIMRTATQGLADYAEKPAFILHDGLLVKESDADYAGWVIQCRFEGYCIDQGWPLTVRPAVSFEKNKREIKERLPLEFAANPRAGKPRNLKGH